VTCRICVVDSFSTDETEKIANHMGADFFKNPWTNHATQFNWALDNCNITSEWVMRIDADEYLEPKLITSIKAFTKAPHDHNAVYFKRKIIFLGRPIIHGFFYPGHILRMWRNGHGRVEQRWMDEHVLVDQPKAITLDGDLTDHNLNDITWWTQKHTNYAIREVYEIIKSEHEPAQDSTLTGQAKVKRFIKTKIYNRLPSGLRGTAYFIYRYFIGAGFLDGKEGFYFHFLQAYWYRVFVDAKLEELRIEAQAKNKTPIELLKERGIF
jgi:glycosyltransferase involved in cell wall biosynthesis